MKRFSVKPGVMMQEVDNGEFVLYLEVATAISTALQFALAHQEDIENDVDDFGELQSILDLVKPQGPRH